MVRSNKIIKRIICLAVMLSVIMTSDAVKLYKNDARAAEGESTVAFLYFQDQDGNIIINSPDSEALTPVTVTGEGSYDIFFDVLLTGNDFANGINLAGIQIVNGESLFPGYIIEAEYLEINGTSIDITGKGNTYSSKGMTNFDLYNPLRYEGDIFNDSTVRTADGELTGASSQLIPYDCLEQQVVSVYVKFKYIKPAASAGLTPLPAGSDNFNVISTQPVAKYTFDNSDGIELNGDARISDGVLELPLAADGTTPFTESYAKIVDLTGTDFSSGITLTADIYVTSDTVNVPVFSFGSSDLKQIYSFSNSFKSTDYIYGIYNNDDDIPKPYSNDWYSKKLIGKDGIL